MKDVTEMTLKELDNEMGESNVPSWPFEPWSGYPERMPAYLRLKAVVDEVVRRCEEEAEKERSRQAVASIARFHEEMGMGREAR